MTVVVLAAGSMWGDIAFDTATPVAIRDIVCRTTGTGMTRPLATGGARWAWLVPTAWVARCAETAGCRSAGWVDHMGTGTDVFAGAERMWNSRPMSCAALSTCPSTHRLIDAGVVLTDRVPPASGRSVVGS